MIPIPWRRVSCVLALAAICGQGRAAEGGATVLNGQINKQTVTRVIADLNTGPKRLDITSRGGDPDAAMDLADYIHAHNVEVHVTGYCMSACASYILPASFKTTVEGGALVLFHNTMSSMYYVAETKPHFAEKVYGPGMRRELALYHTLGLDPRLLLMGQLSVSPECWGGIRDTNGYIYSSFVRSRFDMVAYSEATLRAYGYRFSGHIAETPRQFAQATARNWSGAPLNVALLPPLDGGFEALAADLRVTPDCGYMLDLPRSRAF